MIYKMYFMGYRGLREGRKGYHDLQDVFHGLPWFERRKDRFFFDLQDVMKKDMIVDLIFLVISRYIPFLDTSRYLILSIYI